MKNLTTTLVRATVILPLGYQRSSLAARNQRRTHRHQLYRRFFCVHSMATPYGRSCVGSPRARRVPLSGLLTRMVPSIFAFSSAMGGKTFPHTKGVQP